MTCPTYRTLDGSMITELIRPESDGSARLSVARAVINPGQRTHLHRHHASDEVYYVLAGEGVLVVDAHQIPVQPGEAHQILAGSEHCITCTGPEPLTILCLCAPPYQHEDTQITEAVTA